MTDNDAISQARALVAQLEQNLHPEDREYVRHELAALVPALLAEIDRLRAVDPPSIHLILNSDGKPHGGIEVKNLPHGDRLVYTTAWGWLSVQLQHADGSVKVLYDSRDDTATDAP